MSRAFLNAIWGGSHGRWGELRMMKSGQPVEQRFSDSLDDIVEEASTASEAGYDVYYGVLPREKPSGKAIDVYPETRVLWSDIDAKRVTVIPPHDLGLQKLAALSIINQFVIPASIIVDSGHGYHGYWLLESPAPLDRAQRVMSWIADRIGGDHVHDASRVLRVPGTLNYKYDLHPALVRLVRFDWDRRYRLADFEGYLPPPKEPLPPFRVRPKRVREDLPDWLVELIQDGVPVGRRSEQSFRAMVWLIRYGRDMAEVEALFDEHPEGIGAKYAEPSNGARWFLHTYRAAEEVA